MKKNAKLILATGCSVIATIPFVLADLAGPEILIIPFLGLVLVVGFIVGAIFLIRWIIKKNKNKQ